MMDASRYEESNPLANTIPASQYSRLAISPFGASESTLVSLRPVEPSPSSWIDAQAQGILRGFDLRSIQLLCRFSTFSDPALPRRELRTRWKATLRSFLLRTGGTSISQEDVSRLDVDETVERLLQLLGPCQVWRRFPSWSPWQGLQELDSDRIASDIHEASVSAFQGIRFRDLVQLAVRPAADVDSIYAFFFWHRALSDRLRHFLQRHPEQVGKYYQVETVCALSCVTKAGLLIWTNRAYATGIHSRIGRYPSVSIPQDSVPPLRASGSSSSH